MPRRTHALVLVAAVLALSGCSGSSSPRAASPSSPATTSRDGSSAALTIQSFAYSPTPLTVAPGAQVAVTNKDSAEHTATSDQKGLFKADDIKQGQTVSFTAPTKPGTYTFFCDYHPSMHGTLVVR